MLFLFFFLSLFSNFLQTFRRQDNDFVCTRDRVSFSCLPSVSLGVCDWSSLTCDFCCIIACEEKKASLWYSLFCSFTRSDDIWSQEKGERKRFGIWSSSCTTTTTTPTVTSSRRHSSSNRDVVYSLMWLCKYTGNILCRHTPLLSWSP